MGFLYTTEGTRRVLDTLNTAFDGPGKGLQFIRDKAPPGSNLWKLIETRNWKPGRLARMLQLLPFDQRKPPGALVKREAMRWHWFLKNVVGTSATFAPIRNALADAILKQDSKGAPLNIVRVSFDHVELAGKDNPNVVIFDAPLPGATNGETVRHITLFTVPVPEIQEGTEFDAVEPDAIVKPPWSSDQPSWEKKS
jgi:hypothetical protein